MMVAPGCGLAARHVLWEHEIVGSNPSAPTIFPVVAIHRVRAPAAPRARASRSDARSVDRAADDAAGVGEAFQLGAGKRGVGPRGGTSEQALDALGSVG